MAIFLGDDIWAIFIDFEVAVVRIRKKNSYMKLLVRIPLVTDEAQRRRLVALQEAFAGVCNALAPIVQRTKCWNRVALHHMAYRAMREQFPDMGSQMVCNAIYSVSRASRHVYQHPDSAFNIAKAGDRPLALLQFEHDCPVFFDRHTLSIKPGKISMYTLDGRMRFDLEVREEVLNAFEDRSIREIVLVRQPEGSFELSITLGDESEELGPDCATNQYDFSMGYAVAA